MFKNVPISCFLNTFTPIIQTSTSQTSTRVIFRRKIGANFHVNFHLSPHRHRRHNRKKRRGNFPLLFQKAGVGAVLLTCRSSGSADPRRPCRGGLRREPFHRLADGQAASRPMGTSVSSGFPATPPVIVSSASLHSLPSKSATFYPLLGGYDYGKTGRYGRLSTTQRKLGVPLHTDRERKQERCPAVKK